jgi:hypothetical protein
MCGKGSTATAVAGVHSRRHAMSPSSTRLGRRPSRRPPPPAGSWRRWRCRPPLKRATRQRSDTMGWSEAARPPQASRTPLPTTAWPPHPNAPRRMSVECQGGSLAGLLALPPHQLALQVQTTRPKPSQGTGQLQACRLAQISHRLPHKKQTPTRARAAPRAWTHRLRSMRPPAQRQEPWPHRLWSCCARACGCLRVVRCRPASAVSCHYPGGCCPWLEELRGFRLVANAVAIAQHCSHTVTVAAHGATMELHCLFDPNKVSPGKNVHDQAGTSSSSSLLAKHVSAPEKHVTTPSKRSLAIFCCSCS